MILKKDMYKTNKNLGLSFVKEAETLHNRPEK